MMSLPHPVGLALLAALVAPGPLAVAAPARPAPARRAVDRGTVGPDARPRWPGPLVSRTFLKVRLRYARGKLLQQRIQKVHHPRPPKRRRIVGRFLAMVYQGKRLVDVVPFNFPLLAPVENFTYTGQRIATQMEAHLVTAAEIEVPWVPAVDHIVIRDVGTERRWPLNLAPLTPRPRAPAPRPAPPRGAPPARSSQ